MQTSIETKVLKWALTGKVGASSRCMAAHLTGNECDGSYPHDGADFQRCVGLLDACPELRPLLPKMMEVNAYWRALVPEWGNIEALHSSSGGMQYKKIQEILRPIENRDKNVIRVGEGCTIRFGKDTP
jgi:hypothetical protein